MRNACTLILLLLFAAAPLHAEETGKKVVVLGIDAMDTRLAEKWMDAGDLPNFDKLRKQGHYSPLETSYPPMSPAAWSTMTTGQNPGKTGIFGFLKRREGTYEPELSLARANEQPLLGGGPWMRLLMALGFAFGVTAVALAMGRVANRIFRNRKPVNQLVPASVVVAAVLVSPVGALDARMLALYGIGGMAVGVLIFGYLAALNGLKFRYWLFPLLALAVGAFSFLNNLPETVPQPVTSRSGTTFWKMADDRGVRCRVIGAPVNWPAAEEFAESKMTTGLATPDASPSSTPSRARQGSPDSAADPRRLEGKGRLEGEGEAEAAQRLRPVGGEPSQLCCEGEGASERPPETKRPPEGPAQACCCSTRR